MSHAQVLVVLSSSHRRGAELQGSELAGRLETAGVPTGLVALTRGGGTDDLAVPALGRTALAVDTLRRLRQLCRSAEVVVGFGSRTLAAVGAATSATPARFVFRGIGDPRAWARGRWHRRRTALLYRRPDHVVTLWPGASAALAELYGVEASRLSDIPNARDPHRFAPADRAGRTNARRQLGLPDDAPVVAWLGAFGPEKRVALAAEAVLTVPGLHLAVAGTGPDARDLEGWRRVAPDRIHLLGPLTDPTPLYRAADAAVLTSLTEGMPGVVIEASLCGIPSVATDVGASRLVVGPGGSVVPARASAAEIGRALTQVVSSRDRLGRAARRHAVAQFSWPRVMPRWLDLLDDVRSRSPSTRTAT